MVIVGVDEAQGQKNFSGMKVGIKLGRIWYQRLVMEIDISLVFSLLIYIDLHLPLPDHILNLGAMNAYICLVA